tara:strand:+ start:26407 stop:27459 length:1053 start_codon:yes stop_codon:yes gene_type:complete
LYQGNKVGYQLIQGKRTVKRVAINGLGRVGRLLLRRYLQSDFQEFAIVAVNDPTPADNLIYLLKYDSVYGRADFGIRHEKNQLWLDDLVLPLFAETDPARLPWDKLEIDIVMECSGHFTKRTDAIKHINAGAHRVVISAPSPDADITLVLGVNEKAFDPNRHFVISNASCTTNSLAPPLKVLDDQFGVEQALVTTIHAYTSSQSMVDQAAGKKIRGRAGAVNIIPTATGADAATVLVLPQLKDRLSALALRVPIPDGALTDISVLLKAPVTVAQVNQAFRNASEHELQGILAYSDEDLVSSDIIGNPHSAIIHGQSTRVVLDHFVKLQVWYDNEFAYACRCLDLLERLPL